MIPEPSPPASQLGRAMAAATVARRKRLEAAIEYVESYLAAREAYPAFGPAFERTVGPAARRFRHVIERTKAAGKDFKGRPR